jgi:hypothetical protein
VQTTTSPLVQPIHTRWATYLNMLSSILKHRGTLVQAVRDPEFERLACASRSGMDSLAAEVEADQHLQELTDALTGVDSSPTNVPAGVASNTRYATVYKSVLDSGFWEAASEYIALNTQVAAAITSLSSDSACLSDAVLYTTKISQTINALQHGAESVLFDSELHIQELQKVWSKRAEHVTSFSHLALLLDPRPEYRAFVQSESIILGSVEERNRGNTGFIASADSALRAMVDLVLPDDNKTVQHRHEKHNSLSLVEVKAAILSGALRTFLGVHESKTLKHLQIDEAKLRQVGVDGESPVSFWVNQVPDTCLLREAAIRVMSAKPSSTAVERLWNSFGDNLTAKRRSFKNQTLATVVYAKMNHRILGSGGDVFTEPQFESLLDFVDEVHEEELVQQSKGGVQNEQIVQIEGDIASETSGSGSAGSW